MRRTLVDLLAATSVSLSLACTNLPPQEQPSPPLPSLHSTQSICLYDAPISLEEGQHHYLVQSLIGEGHLVYTPRFREDHLLITSTFEWTLNSLGKTLVFFSDDRGLESALFQSVAILAPVSDHTYRLLQDDTTLQKYFGSREIIYRGLVYPGERAGIFNGVKKVIKDGKITTAVFETSEVAAAFPILFFFLEDQRAMLALFEKDFKIDYLTPDVGNNFKSLRLSKGIDAQHYCLDGPFDDPLTLETTCSGDQLHFESDKLRLTYQQQRLTQLQFPLIFGLNLTITRSVEPPDAITEP